MKSPILGNQEPADCTPEVCGLAIQGEANRIAREQGFSYAKAWNQATRLHPEVAARIGGIQPATLLGPGEQTDPAAIHISKTLQTEYSAAFAAAMAKNQGDIYKSHRDAVAEVGPLKLQGLAGVFNGNRTAALGNDAQSDAQQAGALAFTASAEAAGGGQSAHRTAAYAHQKAAEAAKAAGNAEAAEMFGRMADYHTAAAQ